MKRHFFIFAVIGLIFFSPALSMASETVTVDNFVRAETDMTMARYVKTGALGKFIHIRQPTPIDKQNVIRMNRDTIYSMGVFDLTEQATIVKPDSKGRFQSMQVINQDHYTLAVDYNQGEYTFTKDKVGTRYLCIIIRTFVDANDPADIKIANKFQDQIEVRQKSPGTFKIPEWDQVSLIKMRDTINVLAATRSSARGMFGNKNEVDSLSHLLGTAYGWGRNPDKDAIYQNVVPEKNDGKIPYVLTVSEKVPVDGFVSITVYNAKGFMEKNALDAYSVNNVLGVFVVLVLEKSFEGRHDHGGFIPSMIAKFQTVEGFHVWANVICISGALLVYNIFSALKKIFGEGTLLRALLRPLPDES